MRVRENGNFAFRGLIEAALQPFWSKPLVTDAATMADESPAAASPSHSFNSPSGRLTTLVVKLPQAEKPSEKKSGKRDSGRLAEAHSLVTQSLSWSEHAAEYFAAKRFDKALECADQALRLDNENGAAWHWRGASLMQLECVPEAAQAFLRAVALRPQDAEAWFGFGRALLRLEVFRQAINSFARVLEQAPNHCEALIYQSRAYARLGEYDQACVGFERAVIFKPDDDVLWREYGDALLSAGHTEAAIGCYESVTQIDPTQADNWLRLANLLSRLGRPAEAIAGYHTALELAPQHTEIWFNRGLALASMGRQDDAAKSFQRVLEIAPGDAAATHQMALTHLERFIETLKQGRVFNAKEHWQTAITLGREAKMADWYAQELHYLQVAAALGHQRLVKVLIARVDSNHLLAPLNCALDFLLSHDHEKVTSLPTHIRRQVEAIVASLNPLAACPLGT
jgi:tetratricopeptide (TPR) repeat protein